MGRRRPAAVLRRSSPLALLMVCLLLGATYLAQQRIMTHAFDRLESDQVAQDAHGIGFALDAELRLLTEYGATNAVWDVSYQDVKTSNRADFASNFPSPDLPQLNGIDGILGVGPDGSPRVGGLAGGATYATPPAPLNSPATLKTLFDLNAAAGQPRCGALTTVTGPYLYCGFGSFGTTGAKPASGGLIFLKALGPKAAAAIGAGIDLPIRVVPAIRPGSRSWPALHTGLGTLAVLTRIVGRDRIALMVRIPAGSSPLIIEVVRDRPIHRTALSVSHQLFGLVLLLGAAVLLGLVLAVRRGTRQRIEPLLGTVQAVISSGDRSLRIDSADQGAIGALAKAVDGMLDSLAEQEHRIARDQNERESELSRSHLQQREVEEQMRAQADETLRETVAVVVQELQHVTMEAGAVREAARGIDDRVASATAATASVVEQAGQVDQVAAQLSSSLREVAEIAKNISGIAEQTRLLALNATLEAARAGAAGRGFTVVAGEVKELANETSQSTARIGRTVTTLEQQAAAVASVIAGMGDRTAGIDVAAAELSRVADQQRATLDRLNSSLDQARTRIEGIAAT